MVPVVVPLLCLADAAITELRHGLTQVDRDDASVHGATIAEPDLAQAGLGSTAREVRNSMVLVLGPDHCAWGDDGPLRPPGSKMPPPPPPPPPPPAYFRRADVWSGYFRRADVWTGDVWKTPPPRRR